MRDTVTIYPNHRGGLSFTYNITLAEAKQMCVQYSLAPDAMCINKHVALAAVVRVLKELWGVENNHTVYWPNVPTVVADDFINTPYNDLPHWVLDMYTRMRPEG